MATTYNLDKEYDFFKSHLAEFVKSHPEKYVVIVGEDVIGFYQTLSDALAEAVKEHKPGTFFIELCTSDKNYYNIIMINCNVA
jgi:hypothetical protein